MSGCGISQPVNVTTQPNKKLEHPGIVRKYKPSFPGGGG
jgi:hypothetical protein